MTEKKALKWTFLLLKIHQFLYFTLASLITLVILLRGWPNKEGGVFVVALLLGFGFFNFFIYKGLRSKKENFWNYAMVASSFSLLSLLLPFAILSLKELFDSDRKKNYFKKENEAEVHQGPVYQFPDVTPKSTSKTVVLSCVALSLLVIGIYNYDSITGGADFKVDKNLSTQQLYRIGAECNSQGNTKCGIAIFKRVLEMNPGDLTALANLAMAQTRTGLHEEATKNYEAFFAMGGEGLDVMAFYGRSLNAQGRQTDALKWYARALSQHPGLIDVLENMVQILASQSRYEEAAALMDRFIEKNPSAASLLQSRRETLMEKANEQKARAI